MHVDLHHLPPLSVMREVYVAGVGMTRFAKQPGRTLKDLTAEAVGAALVGLASGVGVGAVLPISVVPPPELAPGCAPGLVPPRAPWPWPVPWPVPVPVPRADR